MDWWARFGALLSGRTRGLSSVCRYVPCSVLPLTPRGSVGGLLNGFEVDGVYWQGQHLKEIKFESISALVCQTRSGFRNAVLIEQ